MSIENGNPENENLNPEPNVAENQSVEDVTSEASPEVVAETETPQEIETAEDNFSGLSLKEALAEMETIVNKDDAHCR